MCTLCNPKVDVEAPLIARHHCLENKQSCELLLEVNLVRLDSFWRLGLLLLTAGRAEIRSVAPARHLLVKVPKQPS